jgi:hypothetical protein
LYRIRGESQHWGWWQALHCQQEHFRRYRLILENSHASNSSRVSASVISASSAWDLATNHK